mmetsp:Transcript_13688/g.29528  ORF Transcript_13688/g.29528 Transcript_13688/m.29528 type:complete len:1410 (-) Transcript_13688:45-4274(-)
MMVSIGMKSLVCCCLAIAMANAKSTMRGYHMIFNEVISTASPKIGFFNHSDPGIRLLKSNKAISVAMWIKWNDVDVATPSYAFDLINSVEVDMLSPFNVNLGFYWATGVSYDLPEGFDASEWHYWACTIDHLSLKAYVDGNLVASTTVIAASQEIMFEKTTLTIGSHFYGPLQGPTKGRPGWAMKGAYDDLTVWARAITQEEVVTHMNKPVDITQILPEDVVLCYNFDVVDCDTDAANGAAFKETCSMLGSDKKFVPNYGSAGNEYDLILGGLNNDNGYGKEWVDSEDASECPAKRPFGQPIIAASTVPEVNSTLGYLYTPQVYHGSPSSTVEIDLSDSSFTKVVLTGLPKVGVLTKKSDGGSVSKDDDISSESALLFEIPSGQTEMIWFTLKINDSPKDMQVHIWPVVKPALPTPSYSVQVMEDRSQMVRLSRFAVSQIVDRKQTIIKTLPTVGKLYQVESFTDKKKAEITSVDTAVTHLGGGVIYVPDPIPYVNNGGDSFTVIVKHFFDNDVTVDSDVFTVNMLALPVDDLPTAQDINVKVEEDAAQGQTIELKVNDVDGLPLIAITSLPQKGKLYTEDGHEITEAFDIFDVGSGVLDQYVDEIANVSSFWGAPIYTGYHPMNLIGTPHCSPAERRAGGAGECPDQRMGDMETDLIVGDNAHINRYHNEPEKGTLNVIGRITEHISGTGADALYSFTVTPMRKKVNGAWVDCLMELPGDFPTDCSTESHAAYGILNFTNVKRTSFSPVPAGVWCPKNQKYEGDKVISGGGEWGPQYEYSTVHDDFYKGSEFPKYTEYIEVKYKHPVYPINVEAGSPRGGGHIVSIKAMDPTGKWRSIFSGSVQKTDNLETIGRGLYHIFQEPICRPPFKTNHLRLEFDTSAETGIGSWNYLEYVKLIGATTAQHAVLRYPSVKVKYVPNENAFGTDSFTYSAYDCGGNRLRSSGKKTVTVQINSAADVPIASTAHEGKFYVYNSSKMHQITLQGHDYDHEVVEFSIVAVPLVGTLWKAGVKLASSSTLEAGPQVGPDKLQSVDVEYQMPVCGDKGVQYEPGKTAFQFRDSFTFRVKDTKGAYADREVVLDVNCEDKGYDSAVQGYCLLFFYLNVAFAVICIVWTIYARSHPVVKAAQTPFLVLIAVGSIISSCTIIPIVSTDKEGPNSSCMLTMWLYTLGFVFTFSPLFAKMDRVRQLFANSKSIKRTHVSSKGMLLMIFKFLLGDIGLVIAWQIAGPLVYTRDVLIRNANEDVIKSAGSCQSEQSTIFLVLIGAYHVLVLVWGSYVCYQTYGITTVFSEAKYVAVALMSNLQLLLLAIPILLIASDTPATSMFVRSGVVFLNDLSVLAFIFIPKMYFCYFNVIEHGTGSNIISNKLRTSKVGSAAGTSAGKTSSDHGLTQGEVRATSLAPSTAFDH